MTGLFGYRIVMLAKDIYKNRVNYYFLLPMYVILGVFIIWPAIQGIYYGFFKFNIGSPLKFVALDNYRKLMQDPVFWIALRNTLYLVVLVVPASLAVSLTVSVIVNRRSQWLKSFVRGAFYLPLVVSAVALALTWKYIYDPVVGLANQLLVKLNLEPVIWLGEPDVAIFAIIFIVFTYNLGKPIILYLASLGGIPETYYEVGRIDGANAWQQFWNITLPLLKPTTLYLTVTGTIGTFQVFVIVHLLTMGGPNNSTQTLAYLLYEKAFVFGDYGVASVVGTFLFALVAIITFVQYKYLSSDVQY